MSARVLTANRLIDGAVVFLGAEGWVEDIAEAVPAPDASATAALEARGTAAVAANEVVDAYLVEVRGHAGALEAVALRERLRALGPSVRTDLGKQATSRGGNAHVPL